MRMLPRAAAMAAALLAGPAGAHVTASLNQAPADQFFTTSFRVPHGCNGAATVAVRIKLPDGVVAVKPQMKPGWTITMTKRKLAQPVQMGHGAVTETVDEVAWRGGPLPDAYYDEFGLTMRIVAPAGTTLWFPTVQECEQGVNRWIEIPAAGQAWGDLKEPAPFVKIIGK